MSDGEGLHLEAHHPRRGFLPPTPRDTQTPATGRAAGVNIVFPRILRAGDEPECTYHRSGTAATRALGAQKPVVTNHSKRNPAVLQRVEDSNNAIFAAPASESTLRLPRLLDSLLAKTTHQLVVHRMVVHNHVDVIVDVVLVQGDVMFAHREPLRVVSVRVALRRKASKRRGGGSNSQRRRSMSTPPEDLIPEVRVIKDRHIRDEIDLE